jgi:hypothetical protein
VRGTKLLAWRVPAVMQVLLDGTAAARPEGSMVPWAQERLCEAARQALAAVASDVLQGLLETVGLESEWVEGERASVLVHLPHGVEPEYVARAVDLENVEAWLDERGRVRVGIGPWHTTKEVDQVILAVTKVVHEFTGLLGVDPEAHGHTHPHV